MHRKVSKHYWEKFWDQLLHTMRVRVPFMSWSLSWLCTRHSGYSGKRRCWYFSLFLHLVSWWILSEHWTCIMKWLLWGLMMYRPFLNFVSFPICVHSQLHPFLSWCSSQTDSVDAGEGSSEGNARPRRTAVEVVRGVDFLQRWSPIFNIMRTHSSSMWYF